MSHDGNPLQDPASFIPLSPQDFQVLLVLLEKPLYGYAIVKASEDARGRPALELGSLYRIINRLMGRGLVAEVAVEQPDTKRKRRYYSATALGRDVARMEALRLRALLATKHAVDLVEG